MWFIHLKCAVLWILVFSQIPALITQSIFRASSSPQRQALPSPLPKPLTPHHHEPSATTNLLSVSIDLPNLSCHLNRISWFVIFCIWLLSCTIIFSRVTVFCLCQYSIPLFGWIIFHCIYRPCLVYLFMCWWTLGFVYTFWPLWIMLCTAFHIGICFHFGEFVPGNGIAESFIFVV